MLFVHKSEGASHIIKDKRGFDDVELPISVANEEALRLLFEDYNAVQAYLAKVYVFGKQRAYRAIEQLEVPACLRTIVEAPVEALVEKPHKKKASVVRSSMTYPELPTPQESSTPTKT